MEPILDVLKWSVIVGAAALALTLLKPLLDKRYSARWRYGAWLVMAMFLLLAPVQWEMLVPEAPMTPPVVIEVPQMEVSVSRQEGVSIQRPAVTPAARPAGTAAAAKKPAALPLDRILTGLWLAGMGLFFAYHLLGTWYFTRKARRWSRCAGEDTARVYGDVQREMKLEKAPPLRVSEMVDSPMVIGLFRPCLLLPGENFAEGELAFILRHELTHYRRRDLWYKLVLLAANGMHWFNPLTWLLRREAERDLELTCDDTVVAGRDDVERRAYSEALLGSIHRQKGLNRAVLSTHFYGGKEVMMERFRNILGKRGRKRGIFVLVVVLAATVTAACALALEASTDGVLSAEELAEWQAKVESPEMDHYIYRMYTNVAYLPSEEKLDEIFPVPEGMEALGHEDINPKVLSGTKNGDSVTLEIEGNFASRLPSGTLMLVDGEPVSFTNPLYTAVETAARELMERTAESYISGAAENEAFDPPGALEFTEKYITNLFCAESMTFDGKTYYVWNLYYGMKPNDIDNVMFAGGMSAENGWVTQSQSPGDPILVASVDTDGKVVLEERTWSGSVGEEHWTWEEYIYCRLHLGMDEMYGILNGWPEISTPFLKSLRDGHETWALDWDDAALSYLAGFYDVYPDNGLTTLRTFRSDADWNAHDQAVLVQGDCGDYTVTLLLAHVCYPVKVWDSALWFWQVVGVKWEPDAPEVAAPEDAPQAGELTADEMVSLTSYFNMAQHNGLLRFPYTSLGAARKYMGLLFYDLGDPVTDAAELEAVAELYGGELFTDCTRLTREEIRTYLSQNFTHQNADVFAGDLDLVMDSISDMPYLEEYDAYYMVHGDTLMNGYTFDRGERDADGVVSLYYRTDLWYYDQYDHLDILLDQPMCARMAPELGSDGLYTWRMLSNEIEE